MKERPKIGDTVTVTIPESKITNVKATVTDVISSIFDRNEVLSVEVKFFPDAEPCKMYPEWIV